MTSNDSWEEPYIDEMRKVLVPENELVLRLTQERDALRERVAALEAALRMAIARPGRGTLTRHEIEALSDMLGSFPPT